MKSKAEIVRRYFGGLRVLDVGGVGYRQGCAYEADLEAAWSDCAERVCLDSDPSADIVMDLDTLPLPIMRDTYDAAAAFDVLEHLRHPVEVLRWIPCRRLLATLPNAMSWIMRRMEEKAGAKHLYSFTPYTASVLLREGGWDVRRIEYQFGKWSLVARSINAIGSLCPSRVATSMVLHCERR